MDALSEALSSVRMTGAIFYDAICTAPWGFAVPHMQDVAHMLAPGTECLVGYHLVAEGRAVSQFEGEAEVALAAGDVVIVPHGDPHTVSNGQPATLIDSRASICSNLVGDLSTFRVGGGGEQTRFVCGYFGCERHAARLFLAGLPARPGAAGSTCQHAACGGVTVDLLGLAGSRAWRFRSPPPEGRRTSTPRTTRRRIAKVRLMRFLTGTEANRAAGGGYGRADS
jgi:Cupin